MTKATGGEQLSRPQKATRLGLSDEIWVVVQSLSAFEAEDRSPAFVDLLERAIAVMASLEEFTRFTRTPTNRLLRCMYGDNTLLGMREGWTIVLAAGFCGSA